MSEVVRDVKFGGGISIGDRRAMALHEWMVAEVKPPSNERIKEKIAELKAALSDPTEDA